MTNLEYLITKRPCAIQIAKESGLSTLTFTFYSRDIKNHNDNDSLLEYLLSEHKDPIKLKKLEHELIAHWDSLGFDKLIKDKKTKVPYLRNKKTGNFHKLKGSPFTGLFDTYDSYIFEEALENYEVTE